MWRFFVGLFYSVPRRFGRNLYYWALASKSLHSHLPIAVIVILTGLLLGVSTQAQTTDNICGVVVDSASGHSISGATVTAIGLGRMVVTDQAGGFCFETLPLVKMQLMVVALGYDTTISEWIFPREDVAPFVRLKLPPRPVQLPSIIVRDERSPNRWTNVEIIDRASIAKQGVRDIPDLLQTVPGITIERSGGSGSPSRIRIRGCDPKHVLVLLDGQRLNDPGTGAADISGVPIDNVESIEIHRGGASAQFGPDALGGVVSISTVPPRPISLTKISAHHEAGSWDARSTSLSVEAPGSVIPAFETLRASYVEHSSSGAYDYRYHVSPGDSVVSGTRINAGHRATFFHLAGLAQPGSSSSISFSVHRHQRTGGLPGPATKPNASAQTEDRRHLVSLTLTHQIHDKGRLQWYAGYSDYDQTFRDLGSTPVAQYHSSYVNRTLTSRLSLDLFDWAGASATVGGEVLLERLRHSDYLRPQTSSGLTRRTATSAYGRLRHGADLARGYLKWRWDMEFGLRYDRSVSQPEDEIPAYPWLPPRLGSQAERYSPQITMSITADGPVQLSLHADHGQSFRLPSLNALFWKGDVRSAGNPDLRPENSVHSQVSAQLQLQFGEADVEIGTTYHHSHVTDLIAWVQSGPQGVWKPVNIGRARISGREDHIVVKLMHGKLTLSYQNSLLDARNRQDGHNSYDKWLTHRPHVTTRLAAKIMVGGVFAGYQVRMVSRRYANDANTKWYDGYRVDDLNVGLERSFLGHWQIRLEYRMDNVLDTDYVLISQHPMPGIEHSVSLQVNCGL